MEAIIGVTDGDGRWGTEMEGGSRPLGSRVAVMGGGSRPRGIISRGQGSALHIRSVYQMPRQKRYLNGAWSGEWDLLKGGYKKGSV